MDAQHILALIKSHAIRSVADLDAAGIETRRLGDGSARTVYAICGTDWVIKFANGAPSQNLFEVAAVQALQEYPAIRDLLPEILFYDDDTDILVMRKYDTPENAVVHLALVQQILGRLRVAVPDWVFDDVNTNNTGLDASGKPRIFDLGIFRPKPTPIRFAK